MYGFDVSAYHHIVVVDDQHRKVWADDDSKYLDLKRNGAKVLKISVNVFGDLRTRGRWSLSTEMLLHSMCSERSDDNELLDVLHRWKSLREMSPEDWREMDSGWIPMDLIVIRQQCQRLLQSFPNIEDDMMRQCIMRYKELRDSNVLRSTSTEERKSIGSDICVLDVANTLLTPIGRQDIVGDEKWIQKVRTWNTVESDSKKDYGLEYDIKVMLSPQGINILRVGAMDLIDVLHHSSSDVVVYVQENQPNVILSMIFMELAYNRYWEMDKLTALSDQQRTFRFSGMVCIPSKVYRHKTFFLLQSRGYALGQYKRIMVVDRRPDRWQMTSGEDFVWDAVRQIGVKVIRMTDGQMIGRQGTRIRRLMSSEALVDILLDDRVRDQWLIEVKDQWKNMVLDDKMQEAEWERLGIAWMERTGVLWTESAQDEAAEEV